MAACRLVLQGQETVSIAERIFESLALGFGGGGSPIVAVSGSHYSSYVAFLLVGKGVMCVFLLAINGETARQARRHRTSTFWKTVLECK